MTELRRFLGDTNYYRRFVRGYAGIASPLNLLLRKQVPLRWTAEHDKAAATLKESLTNAELMQHPVPGKRFLIDCEASEKGLGAVLSQSDEKRLQRPIVFANRALKPNKAKWTAKELEAFAIRWMLKSFRLCIEARPTLVCTDSEMPGCPCVWATRCLGTCVTGICLTPSI